MAKTDKKADKKTSKQKDKKAAVPKAGKPAPMAASKLPPKVHAPAKGTHTAFPAKLPPPKPKKDSSSEESSEDEVPSLPTSKVVPPKAALPQKKPLPKKSSSSESSESDSDESEKEKASKPAPTKPVPVNVPVKKAVPARVVLTTKKPETSDDSSGSDSEVPVAKPTKDSSSSDSSDDSDEDKGQKSAVTLKPTQQPKKDTSSSDSSDDSSDDSVEVRKPDTTVKQTQVLKEDSSDDSSDDSDEAEVPKPTTAPKNHISKPAQKKDMSSSEESSEGSDSSSDESSEDSDVEMAEAPPIANGKRKAKGTPIQEPPKKVKLTDGTAAPSGAGIDAGASKSIFVGMLSWSVDNDWLAQEFSECGEVVSANVQMDRNTGKSRGFGYVHFASADAVEKALKLNGKEIDGRTIKVDRSTAPNKAQTQEKRAKVFGDATSPPSSTLFVGNLSFSTTEDDVWTFFNEYGVKSVRLPTDRETGKPKGFGYVEFEDINGAKKAFEQSKGADIDGRTIRLDYSTPRDGFGGGRGGRGRGDRGGDRGGRGGRGGGDRGWRGRGGSGGRGRGAPRGNARFGGIGSFEGKKTTF